jgi:hypothetical protein
MSSLNRRLAGVSTAALLTTASMLLPVQGADAASAPTCRASMSDATPEQYSDVWVNVSSVANAKVRTVAHYKTTDTVRFGRTGSTGRGAVKYYISGATPGYRVTVDVMVTGPAGASGYCSTSYVPHA